MSMNLDNILIEQKLQSLNIIAQVGITWWVSSIVFCATAVAAVWKFRGQIVIEAYFSSLYRALNFLFMGTSKNSSSKIRFF